MATLSIPTFSNPTNRTDFNNIINMLTNFFVSQGFKQSDASAQAGLVVNLKQQQGLSDAEINTAIATQQNRLNSIVANQNAQAAAVLAAEQPKIAATLALSAAAKVGEGKNFGDNTLITVNGVQQTRAQAASFAPTDIPMCADPDNPRGAKIPCTEADKKLANKRLTTSFQNLPATSKVVAINGVPVSEIPSKPQMLGTVTPITDVSKTFTQVTTEAKTDISKTTTNPATVPAAPATTTTTAPAPTDPIKQITDWLANLFSPVTKPVSEGISATEKAAADALAAAQKQAADLAAAGTKQAADALAAAQKTAGELVTGTEASLSGLLTKLTGVIATIPDLSKTTAGTINTGQTTPDTTPKTTTEPPIADKEPPPPKPTMTTKVTDFLKKYSIPIVISVGAAGSLAVVLSVNKKHGIIQK